MATNEGKDKDKEANKSKRYKVDNIYNLNKYYYF